MHKLFTKISKTISLMQGPAHNYRFYDIAANLTDSQFDGQYYGKKHHEQDREEVINRAKQYGCHHLLIASGSLEDAYHSLQICKQYSKLQENQQKKNHMFSTIGVHPCRAKQPFNKNKWPTVDNYFEAIEQGLKESKPYLVAIGECGLDYDRLEWSSKQEQLQVFPKHFQLAQKYKLPMYLHNRNTGNDFFEIVTKNRDRFSTGVVHSFTGTKQQLDKILELDLYVGINGCSLKTEENLEVLKNIPINKIMLETDSPYCQIRNSHKSSQFVKTKFQAKAKQKKAKGLLIKGRNQPCKIIQVLEVVSSVLKVDPKQLAQQAFLNSLKILGTPLSQL